MVLSIDVNIAPSPVKTSSDVGDGNALEAGNQFVLFVFRQKVEFSVCETNLVLSLPKVAKQGVGPA
jgi:hypothetical protein